MAETGGAESPFAALGSGGGLAPLFFWGLVRVPLAEAIALSFIAPLIALYLAAVLLGEKIQRTAIAASLLGFGGVLVIAAARLAEGTLNAQSGWGIAAILVSAVLYAWNLILQRQQAQLASPPKSRCSRTCSSP